MDEKAKAEVLRLRTEERLTCREIVERTGLPHGSVGRAIRGVPRGGHEEKRTQEDPDNLEESQEPLEEDPKPGPEHPPKPSRKEVEELLERIQPLFEFLGRSGTAVERYISALRLRFAEMDVLFFSLASRNGRILGKVLWEEWNKMKAPKPWILYIDASGVPRNGKAPILTFQVKFHSKFFEPYWRDEKFPVETNLVEVTVEGSKEVMRESVTLPEIVQQEVEKEEEGWMFDSKDGEWYQPYPHPTRGDIRIRGGPTWRPETDP
jgi:hypothetical protein